MDSRGRNVFGLARISGRRFPRNYGRFQRVQAAHVACYIIKKRNVRANWQATKAPLVTDRALQTDRAIHRYEGGGERCLNSR